MKKVCVVTGTRAEFGILSGLMKKIQEHPALELQIIATNMHLSPEYGLTYREIEAAGFKIDKKVHMLLSADTENATAKSVGLGTIGFADAYEDLKPDLLLILGDRYEILAAATAATFYKIPIVHLHGGELTEGAYDDCIRHALTKMSHLHFTSTEEYRKRVIQLGENPDRVFYVGALGVENIRNVSLLSLHEFEKSIKFELGSRSLLITYHPVTLQQCSSQEQVQALLNALNAFPEYKLIFTLPNSDTDGKIIAEMLKTYAAMQPDRVSVHTSLGMHRYLSALQYVTAVVGNSSSGIIEVPSFGIPTLNIGNRQKGRIAADSVYHCGETENEIKKGLQIILSQEFRDKAQKSINPYEQPGTSDSIMKCIENLDAKKYLIKPFYDI